MVDLKDQISELMLVVLMDEKQVEMKAERKV
jgi:hypothetical protein